MVQIVNVQVSQQVASTPSVLQKTGAFVTQGGTNTTQYTATFLTSLADLSAIVASNAAGLELQAMANTFFAQGTSQGVYVLEVGTDGSPTPAEGVATLSNYITNLAGTGAGTLDYKPRFYAYLVPAEWNTESTFRALVNEHSSPTSQMYFYVTTTISTYTSWEVLGAKGAFCVLQSESAPSTEFDAAAFFHVALSYSPNSSNLVSPMAWSYLYGVTAYTQLTATQQITLLNAGMNWVGTGAEGGISNKLVVGGQFMDVNVSNPQGGNPFNYWYAVDWLSINCELYLAAAVINGSNNPQSPLYYNQNGINRLRSTAQSVVDNGISFGMILSPATVQAVPFSTYVEENPSDYAIGHYNGLSLTFVPARGFQEITIYLTASNIPV